MKQSEDKNLSNIFELYSKFLAFIIYYEINSMRKIASEL